MRKSIHTVLTIFSISLLFTACTGDGLFYKIENEEKIIDNNMANIKYADVIVTANYYVARGVSMWYRSKGSSSWSVKKLPGDSLSSMCLYKDKVYYTVTRGNASYLYAMTDADFGGAGSGTLKASFTTTSYDRIWLQVYSDNIHLILNRVDYNSDNNAALSQVYYTDDETTFNNMVLDLGAKPIQYEGVAFGSNSRSGYIWIITNSGDVETGGKLYRTTDNFVTPAIPLTTIPDHFYFSLGFASTAAGTDWLLLSTREDWSSGDFNLYHSSDGGTNWSSQKRDYPFSSFTYNSTALSDYIIGNTSGDFNTQPEGYKLLNVATAGSISVTSDRGTMADKSNYDSSDLIDSAVYSMEFTDPATNGDLIAATSSGIWMFNDSSNEWSQE